MRPTRPVQVPERYPPLRVWQEVDAAAQRFEELQAEGREVHFELHPLTGRLKIQLLEEDGSELRTLTPSDAVAIAGGAPA